MTDLTAGLPVRPDGTIDPDRIDAVVAPHLTHATDALCPAVRAAAEAALADCAAQGHRVRVLETYRADAVERAYWRKGRDAEGHVVRPDEIVTQCHDGATSWHSYRGALDLAGVTSAVITIFVRHGFASGSAWKHHPDYPHFQWAKCPVTPSIHDIADYRIALFHPVWDRYGMGRYVEPTSEAA